MSGKCGSSVMTIEETRVPECTKWTIRLGNVGKRDPNKWECRKLPHIHQKARWRSLSVPSVVIDMRYHGPGGGTGNALFRMFGFARRSVP